MVEFNSSAAAGINFWVWAELQSELDWEVIDGRRPITIQLDPEMVNSGSPHITFAWGQDMQAPMVELRRERMVYCVYSKDVSDVVKAVGLIADMLGRWDWSAQDLNAFLADPLNEATADQKKYDYKEIHVTSMTGPEPPDEEGGYYEGTLIISYAFTVPMASATNQTSGFGRISQ